MRQRDSEIDIRTDRQAGGAKGSKTTGQAGRERGRQEGRGSKTDNRALQGTQHG